MKKSKLLKQNLELFSKLDKSEKRVKDLENKLERANNELAAEKLKNEHLQNEIIAFSKAPDKSMSETEDAKNAGDGRIAFNPEKPAAPEGFGLSDDEEKASEVVLQDDLQYAADRIGELVIESAKCSNALTEGGNTAYMELVNLILGKTEVSKAEILSIAKQDLPVEVKKQKMDAVKASTVEYFESVMAQR